MPTYQPGFRTARACAAIAFLSIACALVPSAQASVIQITSTLADGPATGIDLTKTFYFTVYTFDPISPSLITLRIDSHYSTNIWDVNCPPAHGMSPGCGVSMHSYATVYNSSNQTVAHVEYNVEWDNSGYDDAYLYTPDRVNLPVGDYKVIQKLRAVNYGSYAVPITATSTLTISADSSILTPEPGTGVLGAVSLGVLGLVLRRRGRAKQPVLERC